MTRDDASRRTAARDLDALARLLSDHADRLIASWRARVLADPAVPEANRLPEPELRDHMPQFLETLVGVLRGAWTPASAPQAVLRTGVPHQHARQRLAKHYTLEAALREWAHFRAALIDLCDEHGVHPPADQRKIVHAAIDESLAEAATEMQNIALASLEQSLEEERRLSAKLREEVEMREQFLAVLGHDLRNPLSTIAMGATSLQQRGEPEARDRHLRRIAASAARMGRMIDDLLDVSRVRLGDGLVVAEEHVEICELCQRVAEEFETSDPDRSIAVACRPPIEGTWDRDRVWRAISNLVKNALVHGAPESPVEIVVSDGDGFVDIAVSNLGPDVPDDVRPRLFQPFGRAGHGSRERLGLGLYIVRQIALAHGGDISYTHASGRTSFVLRLPQNLPVSAKPL